MFNVICSESAAILLFFYAINRFSRILSRSKLDTVKKIFSKLTDCPIKALLVGTGVSAAMQSNQAVSLIALSFVDNGIISTFESLPIMFGTPLGTASTAFLISAKFENMGEMLIIIGAILKFTKYKNIGHIIFYFGLLLFALDLMAEALEPIKNSQSFKKIFLFTSNTFVLFLIGIMASFITQGAFIIGILTILVGSNILPIYNANAMAIGTIVGSTLFIGVNVFSMSSEAKKAWGIHSSLVFICSLIMLLFLKLFTAIGNLFGGGELGFAMATFSSRTAISIFELIIYMKCSKCSNIMKMLQKHIGLTKKSTKAIKA